jgi:RND family efflux transporter MFP subunit
LKTRSLFWFTPLIVIVSSGVTACNKAQPQTAQPQGQALPVQTITIASAPVPQSDEYVSTIKSRRSATINPQVDGNLTKIDVHSGDHVRAGQELMEIDPTKQQATVAAQAATEQQKLALFKYNEIQVGRQRKLFADGIISRDALDQAEQAYSNSQADYQSAVATRQTQEKQLGYYRIAAPFDGIIGDVPVHLGDYVSPTTWLTTVDENKDLEAYIYIPTEREAEVRNGLGVEILDNTENLIERTAIDFVSPQVDDALQGILVKAAVRSSKVRTEQLVKARVIWNTVAKPVVPVLAVTRQGGQTFVYTVEDKGGKYFAKQQEVTVGDTVGNDYAVLGGLQNGEKVIVSGTQFLVDGMPIMPLGGGPPAAAPGAGN